MKYIILVHEEKDVRQILNLFKPEWILEYTDEYIYVGHKEDKETERRYVQIEYCQESECDLTDEDRAILAELDSLKYSLVRYNDLSLLKAVLEIFVDKTACYVWDSHGNIIKGSDLMQKWSPSFFHIS